MQCGFHKNKEHTDFCLDCEVPLCGLCVHRIDRVAYCVQCASPRLQQRSRVRKAFLLVGLPLIAGILFVYAQDQQQLNRERIRYGQQAEEVFRFRTILAEEPCNQPASERLVYHLTEAMNFKEARDAALKFTEECAPNAQSLTSLFFTERQMGDHQASLDTAERLIRSFPHKPEGFAYRGLAYQSLRRYESAAVDFTAALSLNPRLLDVPMNLAHTLELLGRPCMAKEPLTQALTFYPGLENRFELELRIQRLEREGGCPTASVEEKRAAVPFDRNREIMVLNAEVNGQYPARLVLDTGASSGCESRIANRIGVSRELESSPVYVQTAGGIVDGPPRLERLAVGGAVVEDLPVLVCETFGKDYDGLLGVNFLQRFQVTIDPTSGQIQFRDPSGLPTDPIEVLQKSSPE